MEASHFVANALPENTGYTWTLTSRLGSIIREVEALYGERDKSWTILGVEFGPGIPMLWYPGDCMHVAIQLSANALESTSIASYQLAHEAVHLLSPTGGNEAPVLEEGIATVFSEDYMLRNFHLRGLTDLVSYRNAAALVRELETISPSAIVRLRRVEPSFAKMTVATFTEAAVDAPQNLINDLLSPFVR